MSSVVLDASAVLAFVKKEPGSEIVAAKMSGGMISAVNYSEVLKKSVEHGGSVHVTRFLLDRTQVNVVSFDEGQAVTAAALFATTREMGLSFADRACLALGIHLDIPVYTADQRLADVVVPIKVVMIRKSGQPKVKKQ